MVRVGGKKGKRRLARDAFSKAVATRDAILQKKHKKKTLATSRKACPPNGAFALLVANRDIRCGRFDPPNSAIADEPQLPALPCTGPSVNYCVMSLFWGGGGGGRIERHRQNASQ